MTFAPVGIKCPDHAGVGAARPRQAPQQTVRSAQRTIAGLDAPATVALVVVNVIIYAITVAQGGAGLGEPGGKLFLDGALIGAAIDLDGQWYRLVTAMFLHASLLHLAFNMLALYWLGSIVEQALGSWRFLALYFVSGIAGSAGGILATFALAHFRYVQPRALGPALVALIAVGSLIVAYVRIESYV